MSYAQAGESTNTRMGLVLLALLVLSFVAFFPGLQGEFISDDQTLIVENSQLRSLDGLGEIWAGKNTPDYWPLTYTVLWLEFQLFGLDPVPYHALNIFLQAISGFVLFLILKRLTIPAAFWIAAVFCVHPVQVESVVWIIELKNLLAGLFFFLSIWMFLKSQQLGSNTSLVISILFFLGSVLSKASTVVLPVVLLLVLWWQKQAWTRSQVLRLAPFFLIALVSGISTLWFQKHMAGATGESWDTDFLERCLISSHAVFFYLQKIIFPADLSFNYARWKIPTDSLQSYLPIASLLALTGIAYFRRASWGRAFGFGFGYFLVLLFPVLGFFTMYFSIFSHVADRWQHLAMIGPVALIGAAGSEFLKKQTWKSLAPILGAVLLILLTWGSWNHAKIFRDTETLCTDTIQKNPGTAIARVGLGGLRRTQGRLEEAEILFRGAVALAPGYDRGQDGLAATLKALGKTEEAKQIWTRLIETLPYLPYAHRGLGEIYAQENDHEKAQHHFQMALGAAPQWPELRILFADSLLQTKQYEEASRELWIVQRQEPLRAEAYWKLGDALAGLNKPDLALRQYERAKDLLQRQKNQPQMEQVQKKIDSLKN